MSIISAGDVKKLREMTSAGVMECKKALELAGGNFDKAVDHLVKTRGSEMAAKKIGRSANQGRIESYIHGNKIGVLLELNCETDFVAKNEDFEALAKNIVLHLAAIDTYPQYNKREDIPEDVLAGIDNIDDYCKTHVLSEQPFIKDPSKRINDLITAVVVKIGENIQVGRFVRFKVGE